MIVKLKKKYREGKYYERHTYRARTGPVCCTPNCPSMKKKKKLKTWAYKKKRL